MLRASFTLAVAAVYSVLIFVPLLTVGLVLPSRWCFAPLFHAWSWAILTVAGAKLTVEGREHIRFDEPQYWVGNHQSAIDIPVLSLLARGRIRFLAKRSLFRIPFFGWYLYLYDFVPIDRSSDRKAKATVDTMLERLKRRPVSMVVFPEGRRCENRRIESFKRGALRACIRSGMPVLPFSIDGTLDVHRRGAFRIRPHAVTVRLAEPIPAEAIAQMGVDELLERVRWKVVRMYGQGRRSDATGPVNEVAARCGDGS